jgi:hypothetical protein
MIRDRPPLANFLNTPEIQTRTVTQRQTRNDSERPRGREAQAVAEVEQRGGDGAEEDAEFEPGEEGAFGGELDFGFDADGDVYAWFMLVIQS